MTTIKLGETYTDTLHGITGIATARTEYLLGCSRVTLEFVKDGEIKREGFDEPMLEPFTEEKEPGVVRDPEVVGDDDPKPEKTRGGPRPGTPGRVAL